MMIISDTKHLSLNVLDTLVNVLYSVQQKVRLTPDTKCPVPINTKVVLDHIEINTDSNKMLIFCTITDQHWLVENMVKWKGYTLIAEIGLPDFYGNVDGPYKFSGVGKVSILEKHVRNFQFAP